MKKARPIVFLVSVSILLTALIAFPRLLLLFTAYSLTFIYTLWGIYHIIIIIYGLRSPFNPGVNPRRHPKISLIIPARDEPILSRTIDVCLNHTEYPRNSKEIVIVTEDPVGERTAIWYSQLYPGNVKPLVRREYFATKPSALNDSLSLCTGEIIGIIDVEDIPDNDVFLKVASAIENYKIDSVQVILRISNQEDNWITKIFSIEYAGWFRVFLNGRSKLGLYTPLGGTGNYFKASLIREIGRWDPLNLAEDAEVAIRFYLSRRRTIVIDARHWEEAPTNFKAWLKQRTRWFRGWIQSLVKYLQVLSRPSVTKRIGFINTLSIIFMLIAPLIVVLNWIAYSMTVYWLLEYLGIVPFKLTVDLFPWWAILPLSFNAIYYYTWIAGAVLEGISTAKVLLKYIPHMIYYMNFMMPIAAFRAFYQEIFREVFWEKTKHVGRGVKWTILEKQQ
jgi:cellulose synthase/poly-beta-1,6-N-acetylglucosamine synthase-like glycosyltransferase